MPILIIRYGYRNRARASDPSIADKNPCVLQGNHVIYGLPE